MTGNQPGSALITGASRGLGRALALELARRGWHLIIDGRTQATLHDVHLELSRLTGVTALVGDVTDGRHRRELRDAVAANGRLDALINNAGGLGPSPLPSLLNYPLEALERLYRVNVFAPLAILQTVHPFLKVGACIINVTSDAAVEAYAGWGGYGSSKAALEQISAVLAEENPSLRIYWVDPGDMRTQMQQDAFPGEDVSDRPLPESSVPGFISLLEGGAGSGRYQARRLAREMVG
jgi:NAD(P)-dependent dehydrogenase (short-subunit alcohol dehydrogenase family)